MCINTYLFQAENLFLCILVYSSAAAFVFDDFPVEIINFKPHLKRGIYHERRISKTTQYRIGRKRNR